MKIRSNCARSATEVTTRTGTETSSFPVWVMIRPASFSSRARAGLLSRRISSSPARVRHAPTNPPRAPAPTIRMRTTCLPPAPCRGSVVLPCRPALLVECSDSFANVVRYHELVQKDPLGFPPRLLERPAGQPAGQPDIHAHDQRAGP